MMSDISWMPGILGRRQQRQTMENERRYLERLKHPGAIEPLVGGSPTLTLGMGQDWDAFFESLHEKGAGFPNVPHEATSIAENPESSWNVGPNAIQPRIPLPPRPSLRGLSRLGRRRR